MTARAVMRSMSGDTSGGRLPDAEAEGAGEVETRLKGEGRAEWRGGQGGYQTAVESVDILDCAVRKKRCHPGAPLNTETVFFRGYSLYRG